MLTLGCHYPTMVLDSGTRLFFFLCTDDVLCILDDQNCSTCPYMKMSSSVEECSGTAGSEHLRSDGLLAAVQSVRK